LRVHLISIFRLAVALAAMAPLVWLGWAWQAGELGVMPAERVMHYLGRWGLGLLLATLCLGPAMALTGWPGFMAVRRQMGMWSFTYLGLHAVAWAGLDMRWDWEFILLELADIQYLQLGLISLVLLVPLALTSFQAARQFMGLTKWRWLHQLAYVAAAGGVGHYSLVVRDVQWPLVAATAAISILVLNRIIQALRARPFHSQGQ